MTHIVFFEKPGCGGNARQRTALETMAQNLGIEVRLTPLAGLGLGAQIGWLTRHARACEDYHERTGTRPGPAAAASAAAPWP